MNISRNKPARSIRPCRLASQRLDRASPRLVVEAARPRGVRRTGGEARLRPLLRLDEQGGETGAGVLAVARLARISLGENDDHAVLGGARSRKLDEPDRDIVWQAGRMASVEPELDRARHLVDVLSARPRGAD